MSGGIAFVLDEFGELESQCNKGLVDLAPVTEFGEREVLRRLVEQHAHYTGSARAKRELGQWARALKRFVAVVPREYRQAVERQAQANAARATATGPRGLRIGEARHA